MTRTILTLSAALAAAAFALPARADNGMYDLKTVDAKVAPGAKGTAQLTIAAKGGWHVNMEETSPFKLTLTPDKGVEVAKASLTRADLAVKDGAAPRFDIAFTAPAEAGKKTIAGELRFIMCQETACKPVKEKVAINVDVAAAAAPAPAAPAAPTKKKS